MSRLGTNPAKKYTEISKVHKLDVIIPVYIPNHEGYFRDSFEIFKLCLNSLHLSKSSPISITVVLNGCAKNVLEFSTIAAQQGRIDNLFVLKENIGKVNAILKAVAGSESELFLVTDADVLFLNGFDSVIFKFFSDRRAGFLGLQPVYNKSTYFTSLTRLMLTVNLRRIAPNEADMNEHARFHQSIGSEKVDLVNKIGVVNIGGVDCVLGTGHFCFATHRSTFENIPKLHTEYFISKGSERKYLDQPSFYTGLMRLSVRTSVALHMGNTMEPWMSRNIEESTNEQNIADQAGGIVIPERTRLKLPRFILKVLEKVF
jgi:hypothetical protein